MGAEAVKEARIKELEAEISKTKYNKATQHHVGLTKAKIAKLRQEIEVRAKSASKGSGYAIRKHGDASVALLGFPSVGKSTLLNALAGTQSKTAAYAFTTLTAIPGMLEHRGARIQVVDIPGLVEGAAAGTGRGKEVLAVIRSADLVLMIIDAFNVSQVHALLREVYDSGIRLDEDPPRVVIKNQPRGGVKVGVTVPQTHLDQELIEGILREFRIINADVVLREDVTVERFIDAVEGNRIYIPSVLAINKVDMLDRTTLAKLKTQFPKALFISAQASLNLEALKDAIFEGLRFMRIFLKEPERKADLQRPLIVKKGSTVGEVADKIHRDFKRRFRFAKVWGPSAKFPGQKFTLDHVLKDGDVLQIVLS